MIKSATILLCLSLMAFLQENKQFELTVVVENIKDVEGILMIAVFDDEKKYLKESVLNESVKVSGKPIEEIKLKLPKGEYAIAIFHDLNANETLDKSFVGIPTEAFGFSNKSIGLFGPPSFKDTKFQLTKASRVNVELKHF